MSNCSLLARNAVKTLPSSSLRTKLFTGQSLPHRNRVSAHKRSRSYLDALGSASTQLHDAVHMTLAALVRRPDRSASMSPAANHGDVGVFVLAGPGAPELKELEHLPDGVSLLGTGSPSIEVKGEPRFQLESDKAQLTLLMHCALQTGQRRIGRKSRCCSSAEQAGTHPQSRTCRYPSCNIPMVQQLAVECMTHALQCP